MAAPPLRSATNGHPGRTRPGSTPPVPDSRSNHVPPPRPRRGAWAAAGAAGLVVLALCVLVLQNTQPVPVSFLAVEGSVPLALLIAGVGGAVVVLTAGTARIGRRRGQVRRRP